MSAINDLVNATLVEFVNPGIRLFSAFAFVWFLYGMFIFIYHKKKGNTDGVSNGKRHMIWGIIGLVIIYSAYAIYHFITSFFN